MISPTMDTRWHSICLCVCVCVYQDLPKHQLVKGGGYSVTENIQSPKICLNANLGGGYSVTENIQSPKICLNSKFRGGGGGILYYRIGVFCRICTKFSTTPAGSCITDSLSHTMYVETNDPEANKRKWRIFGQVLDRFFFLVYFSTLVFSFIFIFPQPHMIMQIL